MTPQKPSLTEEMIMNDDFMGKLKGWRRFRIEYEFEGSSPEGVIYLPSCLDPSEFETLLEQFIDGAN